MKYFLKYVYELFVSLALIFSLKVSETAYPLVWYGGARQGNKGGANTKLRYLTRHFPNSFPSLNKVYLLSNSLNIRPFALRYLKRRGVPIILNQNGVFYKAWYTGDVEKANRKMRYFYHNADFVIWQSEFCRISADKFLDKRQGEGRVIPNAVDTSSFMPLPKDDQDETVFLVAGNITDDVFYRVELAIKSFHLAKEHIPNSSLHIAGHMSQKSFVSCSRLVHERGLEASVKFLGAYTESDAPSIFSSADVFLMLKHNDPCPNTVLEALSSGLAVIYSDSGGVPELVGTDAGIPVFVEQSYEKICVPHERDIAKAMCDVKTNLRKRQAAARERAVKHFSLERWIAEHEKIFLENRLS